MLLVPSPPFRLNLGPPAPPYQSAVGHVGPAGSNGPRMRAPWQKNSSSSPHFGMRPDHCQTFCSSGIHRPRGRLWPWRGDPWQIIISGSLQPDHSPTVGPHLDKSNKGEEIKKKLLWLIKITKDANQIL